MNGGLIGRASDCSREQADVFTFGTICGNLCQKGQGRNGIAEKLRFVGGIGKYGHNCVSVGVYNGVILLFGVVQKLSVAVVNGRIAFFCANGAAVVASGALLHIFIGDYQSYLYINNGKSQSA